MLILGVVLLLIGVFAKIPILTTIGIIVAILGLVMLVLGATGRANVGGRKYWY